MNFGVLILCLAIILGMPLAVLFPIVRDVFFGKGQFLKLRETLAVRTHQAYATGAFAWLITWWILLSYGEIIDPKFLPYPHKVVESLLGFFKGGEIFADLGASIGRIAVGFLSAALSGTVLGVLAGSFPRFSALIMPPNSFIRYIPPTAFVGLFILWWGVEELSKIALIFAGVFFFLLQMVADQVANVPHTYLEVAYTLGASRGQVFWRVIVPAASPDILIVWRVNMAAAWIFLVVAEFIASQEGLGHLMSVAQRFFRADQLFAAILLIGIVGLVIDLGFEGLMRLCFAWRRQYVQAKG